MIENVIHTKKNALGSKHIHTNYSDKVGWESGLDRTTVVSK